MFFSEKPENKKEIVNFIFAWTTFLCLLEILKQHALPEKEEQVPVKTTFYLGLSRYFTYFCEKNDPLTVFKLVEDNNVFPSLSPYSTVWGMILQAFFSTSYLLFSSKLFLLYYSENWISMHYQSTKMPSMTTTVLLRVCKKRRTKSFHKVSLFPTYDSFSEIVSSLLLRCCIYSYSIPFIHICIMFSCRHFLPHCKKIAIYLHVIL